MMRMAQNIPKYYQPAELCKSLGVLLHNSLGSNHWQEVSVEKHHHNDKIRIFQSASV